ncbi:MAG: Lrp/AsnC family transcriptional regulator [Mucilaginibacter sp.]|jgi:Lrp/AsnC family leucine-responsive transcriptional regulator|nr:Lrp/AsnC family transcriptional regulator [Mucilaginibacter sp.]
MQALDDFDKKLLRLLQENNRLTSEELSKLVNLSQSAIQRRISRLRSDKVIEADVSIISPAAAGIGITCIVDLILHEGSSKSIEKFKDNLVKCTEVAQCYYVTGTYDFVLIVNTRDMVHFEAFSKKYLMDNPNLKHFYTHVVMDKVKIGFGVAI